MQFFDDDGHRTEAVGLLERAEVASGEVILHVRKRDDALVTVPLRRVRFGKVIPTARR